MGNMGPLGAVQSGKEQSTGCDSTAYNPYLRRARKVRPQGDPLIPVLPSIPSATPHALRTVLPNGLGGTSIISPAQGSRLFAITGRCDAHREAW